MDSYTLVKKEDKYGRITNEVYMMRVQDPNWEKLLKENFALSSLCLMDVMKETMQWIESWQQPQTVTNTPLHRKKDMYGKHK